MIFCGESHGIVDKSSVILQYFHIRFSIQGTSSPQKSIATSLEIMVSKGNHPQMAELFRLVKYDNLPECLKTFETWTILNAFRLGGFASGDHGDHLTLCCQERSRPLSERILEFIDIASWAFLPCCWEMELTIDSRYIITHMLHGAGIFTTIYPINGPNVTIYSSTMDPMGSINPTQKTVTFHPKDGMTRYSYPSRWAVKVVQILVGRWKKIKAHRHLPSKIPDPKFQCWTKVYLTSSVFRVWFILSTGPKRAAQRTHWNLGVRGLTRIQQGFDFIVHLR